MPLTLPTPEELAALNWYQRDRVLRAARRLLAAYGEHVVPTPPSQRYALTDEQRKARDAAWGEQVRAEARRLAGECA